MNVQIFHMVTIDVLASVGAPPLDTQLLVVYVCVHFRDHTPAVDRYHDLVLKNCTIISVSCSVSKYGTYTYLRLPGMPASNYLLV